MFGLGVTEVLILTVVLFALGGPIALLVILAVVLRKRNSSGDDARLAQVQEEDRRLRDQSPASGSTDATG